MLPPFPDIGTETGLQDDAPLTEIPAWARKGELVLEGSATPPWLDLDAEQEKDDGLIHETPEQRQEALNQSYSQGVQAGIQQARATMEQELREQLHQEIYQHSHEQGQTAGYQAGYDAGLKKSVPEMDQQITLLKQTTEAMQIWQTALQHQQLQELRELVCALTEQVVLQELKLSSETVERSLLSALSALEESSETPVILVHPRDREFVTMICTEHDIKCRVMDDETLSPGGCRVQTSQADIDASLDRRLKLAMSTVREVFTDAG
ncbi:FliH/SctL family protein [Parendozoicomonas haliclonae]|uniref:Flagellar assembly protein FliH n=1 Tax=Parendozoicomonas haliclonae TaxID=1960125 RepID=A0A1X7ANH5_9GAMM|nr:FliH/SctL family protein [Parendozoicomonas haliclonae]SMA49630.1 flagellar assembly protein H [Parendozoicomonas haliclonae]